jgi:hypothetical protein
VYLLRQVTLPPDVLPKAKIPTVLLPAADSKLDATVAAVAELTTSPEYVYLSRMVDRPGMVCELPNEKMPNVVFPAADPSLDPEEAAVAAATVHPE